MIGKWNKSVILTYVGLTISIIGIILVLFGVNIKYAFICLILSGICDMFDGTIARKVKRTKEEKAFGIELDSLVDVISFIALPLVLVGVINYNLWIIPLLVIYGIFAIARLAHFNITTPSNKPVKYYTGLPVTYAALIFPITYLLSYFVKDLPFVIIYDLVFLLVSVLFITRISIPKPRKTSSIVLVIIALVVSLIYIFV